MSRVQIPSSAPVRRAGSARPARRRLSPPEAPVADPASRSDRTAVERAIADLIAALGLDPAAEPELAGTPGRVADLYAEALAGLAPGAEPELATFPAGDRGTGGDLVVVRDLP